MIAWTAKSKNITFLKKFIISQYHDLIVLETKKIYQKRSEKKPPSSYLLLTGARSFKSKA